MSRANLVVSVLAAAALGAAPAHGQAAPRAPAGRPAAGLQAIGHSGAVSGRSASLQLDLSDGSTLAIELASGRLRVNDEPVADYPPGGPFERAWRALLARSGDLTTAELLFAVRNLPAEVIEPDARVAAAALTSALAHLAPGTLPGAPPDVRQLVSLPPPALEGPSRLGGKTGQRVPGPIASGATGGRFAIELGRIATGLASLFGTLIALASLGFGALFFVPERLDVVAGTVRRSPIRCFFAGLFAEPLIVPALVTLLVGLVLTVVGILALPVAVIGFVLVLAAALIGGYLAVARVVGEIYLRRRSGSGDYTGAWYAYRTLVYGLVGLLAIWVPALLLRWVPGAGLILLVTALVFTWAMVTTGFGAVVLSKGGGRQPFDQSRPALAESSWWTAPAAAQRSGTSRSAE